MPSQTGASHKLWLFMLEHGGRWTAAELAEQIGSEAPYADDLVRSMARTGAVTRYRSSTGRKNGAAFGVSPANRVPLNLKVGQLVEALGVRTAIDSRR